MSRSDISEPVSLAVLPNVSFPAINLKSAMLAFGRLPPDEAAVREAREAATGSGELHST